MGVSETNLSTFFRLLFGSYKVLYYGAFVKYIYIDVPLNVPEI